MAEPVVEPVVESIAESVDSMDGRILVFADVHSNLEAFRAVLESAGKPGVDFGHAVFLGDAVGYNASPNECIALLRELKDSVEAAGGRFAAIAGNHDDCLLRTSDMEFERRVEGFNELAQASLRWTRRRVNESNKEWLWSLLSEPSHADGFRRFFATRLFYACHGGPGELYDGYAGFDYDPRAALESLEQRVLFVGHTHEATALPSGDKLFVNAPAVGQPRDGDSRAGYVVFDTRDAHSADLADALSMRRVEYDVEEAARKIIHAGLPTLLAERLSAGT